MGEAVGVRAETDKPLPVVVCYDTIRYDTVSYHNIRYVTASHRLFGLITWIPDNVMKWIGHNPHALGEQDAESKIRASFGGFTGTMQNALNPGTLQKFRGKTTPGGGGGGSRTEELSTQQTGQASANSQARGGTPVPNRDEHS